jgi:integrative and conjugative element protein (TIGR02256 family)
MASDITDGEVTPWFVLYPKIYRIERERLRRRYPDFYVSETDLANGTLALAGLLYVDHNGERIERPVLLEYGADTPAQPPTLTPLRVLPAGSEWRAEQTRSTEAWMLPVTHRRHQHPNGVLCVVEADAYEREEHIHGDDVLFRAQRVLSAAKLGVPAPFADTEEADLEAYFSRFGEIVLGPAFFDPALKGEGKWSALPLQPGQRAAGTTAGTGIGRDHLLWVGVLVTSRQAGGVIEHDVTSGADEPVQRAFPWIVEATNAQLTVGPVEGSWFDIPTEPLPLRTGADVAAVLDGAGIENARGLIGALGLLPLNQRFLALRYPRRKGVGRDWLFLYFQSSESPPKDARGDELQGIVAEIMAAAQVSILRTHALLRDDLEFRNGPTFEQLRSRTAAILGCGALGSDVAVTLAKAGVGAFVLLDPDIMKIGNVVRHGAGLWSTGMSKVDAVRHLIHQHNPFAQVVTHADAAGPDPKLLQEVLRECEIVVSTIANENAELLVNDAAIRAGRTVIFGRALRAGSAARVFRVRAGEDACKRCLALHRADAEAGKGGDQSDEKWIDIPGLSDELLGHECGNPITAGSAADLRFAADLTARAVLDELGAGASWNSLVWTREPLPEVAEDLARPYSVATRVVKPHPHCPTCRRPRVTEILVAESAHRSIVAMVEAKPSVETGGVLLGFQDDTGAVIVLEATAAGPCATETAALFERDAEFVQERLDDANRRLGLRGQYVGEWHSHLEPRPRPSARDIESLTGIASAPGYLTNEPVMLIAGLDPMTGRVDRFHSSCFPLGMRMHARVMRVVPDAPPLERPVGGDVSARQHPTRKDAS